MDKAQEVNTGNFQFPAQTLVSLLPVWLISFAVSFEGFPGHPFPFFVAYIAFFGGMAAMLFLILKNWGDPALLLVSLVPFTLLYTFDEITTTYKTPLIFTCTVILTAGILLYLRIDSVGLGWLVLGLAATIVFIAANHAAAAFWNMASELGYQNCFPDFTGCPPLADRGEPWWQLFSIP